MLGSFVKDLGVKGFKGRVLGLMRILLGLFRIGSVFMRLQCTREQLG